MDIAGRMGMGFLAILLAGNSMGSAAFGQAAPGSMPAASAPVSRPASAAASATASAPATTRAKRPAVAEILSQKTVNLDFTGATIHEVLQFIGKSFDVEIEIADTFDKDLTDLITMNRPHVGAREAINLVNTAIQPKGYSIVESVRDDTGPAHVVLTVTQIKKDAGHMVPVYAGMDPDKIPEGNEMRTQVIEVKYMDLEKYRDMITAALGPDASININMATRTLIVTDTSTHMHTLAKLLQVLDKPPAEGAK